MSERELLTPQSRPSTPPQHSGDRISSTPAARRLAIQQGIELADIRPRESRLHVDLDDVKVHIEAMAGLPHNGQVVTQSSTMSVDIEISKEPNDLRRLAALCIAIADTLRRHRHECAPCVTVGVMRHLLPGTREHLLHIDEFATLEIIAAQLTTRVPAGASKRPVHVRIVDASALSADHGSAPPGHALLGVHLGRTRRVVRVREVKGEPAMVIRDVACLTAVFDADDVEAGVVSAMLQACNRPEGPGA